MRIGGRRSHVGIIRSINRAEPSLAGDSALEMLRGFLGGRLFDWVGATAEPESTRGGKSGEDGFQALMVMIVRADGKREVAGFSRRRGTNANQRKLEACATVPFTCHASLTSMIEPEILLHGYRIGVFPMAMEDGAIEWFSPDPRGILPLAEFHVPHALQRAIEKKKFEIRIDVSFAEVIKQCADRAETWISGEIIEGYTRLHELGHAHSVEAWLDGELVGGLYGVSIGGAFFGESMFHLVRDASKIALCALVQRLRARRFALLDTQWVTAHLEQFGAVEISRRQYLDLVDRAVQLPRTFVD